MIPIKIPRHIPDVKLRSDVPNAQHQRMVTQREDTLLFFIFIIRIMIHQCVVKIGISDL